MKYVTNLSNTAFRLLQKGILFALVAHLSLGCSRSRSRTCSGSSAQAVLSNSSLQGEDSGFLGGFIEFNSTKGPQNCTVVLDVTSGSGTKFKATAWTGNHCKPALKSTANKATVLNVYANKGYYSVKASSYEAALSERFDDLLEKTKTSAEFKDGFRNFVLLDEQSLPSGADFACLSTGLESNTFCATLGDTTLYDFEFETSSVPKLSKIVSEALEKRNKLRAALAAVSGTSAPVAAANEFSSNILEYWRTRAFFEFAPMADLWMTCTSPVLRQAFLEDAKKYNASYQYFESEAIRHGEKFDANASAVDANSSPHIFDSKDVGAIGARDSWSPTLVQYWGTIDVSSYLKSCSVIRDIEAVLKENSVFGKTIWQDLQQAGLLDGQTPKAGSALNAYKNLMVIREEKLRKKLLVQWTNLFPTLVQGSKMDNLYVHSNIALKGSNCATDGAKPLPCYQFSVFSMNSEVFNSTLPQRLDAGILFQKSQLTNLSFEKGDSGTLFSFKGQIPLLTLNSVDGHGTSGNVAVVPLPVDPSIPDPVAPAPADRDTFNEKSITTEIIPASSSSVPSPETDRRGVERNSASQPVLPANVEKRSAWANTTSGPVPGAEGSPPSSRPLNSGCL